MILTTKREIPATINGEQLFVMTNVMHCDYCTRFDVHGGSRHLWTTHNAEHYCPDCANELMGV